MNASVHFTSGAPRATKPRALSSLFAALSILALLGCRTNGTEENRERTVAKTTTIETIRVAIGTQDTTINCATGGPLVRELHLLEKYLPRTGKYEAVHYNVQWENQPTGAQLNSKYLANQLDIVH